MHRTAARKGLLRPLPPMDLPFLVLVLTLVAFGLVMLCSASSAVALYRRQDAFAYVRPQLLYAAMGLVAMWMASRVDYHIYHKLAWPLLALSLVLLTAVLFMPEYNGCKRWLVLPGLGTLQPSEIAKFAVVLVFAHIIALNHDRMDSFAVGVVPFALVLGVVAALMLLEPHLSGTLLILGIGAVLMFVGGTGLRWFMLAGAGGAAAIGTAIATLIGNVTLMNWYYHKRIGLNIPMFWKHIFHLLPSMLLPFIAAVLLAIYVYPTSYFGVAGIAAAFALLYGACMWLFGMNRYERGLVTTIVRKFLPARRGRRRR